MPDFCFMLDRTIEIQRASQIILKMLLNLFPDRYRCYNEERQLIFLTNLKVSRDI